MIASHFYRCFGVLCPFSGSPIFIGLRSIVCNGACFVNMRHKSPKKTLAFFPPFWYYLYCCFEYYAQGGVAVGKV